MEVGSLGVLSIISCDLCRRRFWSAFSLSRKTAIAHPHVFFSSHLCWNLSASLTFPSLISISTFKFKDTRATESPHFVLFISSIPIPVWFTRQSVVCLAFSTIFLDCDISVCAHSWRSTSGHALWHTVEVRGQSQLSDLLFNLMWSRDFLSHPHHCECQEHWPVDYWGLSCVLCHSPHRNAGIADALATCLAFTGALGILFPSPSHPPSPVLDIFMSPSKCSMVVQCVDVLWPQTHRSVS